MARAQVTRDDVVRVLHRIAFLLERGQESPYRAKAYRGAGDAVRDLKDADWSARAAAGRWRDLPGVGERTESVITDVLLGRVPRTLTELENRLAARAEAATPAGRSAPPHPSPPAPVRAADRIRSAPPAPAGRARPPGGR